MSEKLTEKPGHWYGKSVATVLLLMGIARSVGAAEPAAPVKPAKVEIKVASWKDVQARVAAHKGAIVVIDAWSTSCPPCIKELPKFVALHKKHYAAGLRCISFNCDYDNPSQKPEQSREPVLKFLTKHQATCENVLSSDPLEKWLEAVDLASIPAVFVYGRDGRLVKRFDNDSLKPGDNEFTYANVTLLVEKLLKEPAPTP